MTFQTYTVTARLTNTENKCLTKPNLQSVALSIPHLHYRLTVHPYAPGLLHLVYLHIAPLPLDNRPHSKPTPQKDYSSRILPRDRRFSLEHSSSPLIIQPVTEDQHLGSQGDRESCIPDWMLCDGSFVPKPPGEEWTPVNYGGNEFKRAFSPVMWTDNVADILGRCNISDYTAYEQFVLSVDVDILCEDNSKDSSSTCRREERSRYQDLRDHRDQRPQRQHRSRHT